MQLDATWYEEEGWRGYVLHQPRAWLLQGHIFPTWVSGIQHASSGAQHPGFAPGHPLSLVPEPHNPGDSNAAAVWNADRTARAGYVPRVVVADLRIHPGSHCGLAISEQFDRTGRIGLDILACRELPVLRQVPTSTDGTAHAADMVARWRELAVRRAARIEELREQRSQDPFEQMRLMAEALDIEPDGDGVGRDSRREQTTSGATGRQWIP